MSLMSRRLLVAGALLMALATVIGALAAHVLKPRLPLGRFEVLQTAVHYQFFHALGLLALGLLADRQPGRALHAAGLLVLAGVLLFSGSLYAIVAGAPAFIGVVTPLGGLCLIGGWLCAAWALASRSVAKPLA